MEERHPGTIDHVVSGLYLALVIADAVIVADVLSGGNLHRWGSRQSRALYRWVTEPMQVEADVRCQAAWVIWEAMELLEEAQL